MAKIKMITKGKILPSSAHSSARMLSNAKGKVPKIERYA